ncbi:MAG: DNA polymerase III subunit chi [Methylococcales bacterium]|jgi:DNA polymerase-3 subunit chi|nr:DNA polymerase III subunit chi [Methylococcaceae bacterium]
MPEISFYILPGVSLQDRHLFACRLIERAYRDQQFCYVYTDNHQQSLQLDNHLWTFKPGSFIPHQILEEKPPAFEQSILIGTRSAPDKWQNIIVNLSSHFPENISQVDRILEILDNNEEIKQAGRVRYKQYQQAGLNISTHTL